MSNDDYGKVNLLMHKNIPIQQSIAMTTVETIKIPEFKLLLSDEYLDMGADMESSRIHDHPIGEYILPVETKGSTNSSEYAYFPFVGFLGVEIFNGKIFEKLIDIVNQIKSDFGLAKNNWRGNFWC